MTDFELQAFLELLARLVECKATENKLIAKKLWHLI